MKKNPIAMAGGKARWKKIPKKKRSEIMSNVAKGIRKIKKESNKE